MFMNTSFHFKKLLTIACLVTCSLAIAAEQQQQPYKIRWVLAHQPARVFERAAKNFAAEIEKNSKGRVVVEISGLDKNGEGIVLSPSDAFGKVQRGDVEMCQTYTTYLGLLNRSMWALDLPYLFKDHEHATRVLDGKIGARILAGLDGKGVKGMAFTYSGGYRIIPTANKPITKVEDFKDLKIKVSESPVASAYLKELGANPVNIEDADHYAKGVDGYETTYARLENIAGDKSTYINETGHSLFLTSIIINKNFYDKLPADLKKIVADAVLRTAKLEREDSILDGAKAKEEYIKKGIKVETLSAKERARLMEIAEKVQKKFDNFFPAHLVSDIKHQ